MLDKQEKEQLINNFRRHEQDTGSPEVQIAILTKRISDLTEALENSKELPILAGTF